MDAARKQKLSEQAKERWEQCKKLAEIFGKNASDIQSVYYTRIKQAGHLNRVLEGDETAIEIVKKGIIAQTSIPRIHKPREDEKDELTIIDHLKITQWFVRKLGSVELAQESLSIYKKLANRE